MKKWIYFAGVIVLIGILYFSINTSDNSSSKITKDDGNNENLGIYQPGKDTALDVCINESVKKGIKLPMDSSSYDPESILVSYIFSINASVVNGTFVGEPTRIDTRSEVIALLLQRGLSVESEINPQQLLVVKVPKGEVLKTLCELSIDQTFVNKVKYIQPNYLSRAL